MSLDVTIACTESSDTSMNVTVPEGTVEDDLLVLILFQPVTLTSSEIGSFQADWSALHHSDLPNTYMRVFYRYAPSSVPAYYAVTCSENSVGFMLRVSGGGVRRLPVESVGGATTGLTTRATSSVLISVNYDGGTSPQPPPAIPAVPSGMTSLYSLATSYIFSFLGETTTVYSRFRVSEQCITNPTDTGSRNSSGGQDEGILLSFADSDVMGEERVSLKKISGLRLQERIPPETPPMVGTGAGNLQTASVNSTSMTITTPTDTAAGDVLVAFLTGALYYYDITPGSGWSLMAALTNTYPYPVSKVYYRPLTAAPASSYGFTFGGSMRGCGALVRVTGCDIENAGGLASVTPSYQTTPLVAPSVGFSLDNSLLLTMYCQTGAATYTPGSSQNEVLEVSQTGLSMCVNKLDLPSGSSSGTKNDTPSTVSGLYQASTSLILQPEEPVRQIRRVGPLWV